MGWRREDGGEEGGEEENKKNRTGLFYAPNGSGGARLRTTVDSHFRTAVSMVNILGNIICTQGLNITTFVIALQYGVLVRYPCYTDRYLTLYALCIRILHEQLLRGNAYNDSGGLPSNILYVLGLDRHDFQGA